MGNVTKPRVGTWGQKRGSADPIMVEDFFGLDFRRPFMDPLGIQTRLSVAGPFPTDPIHPIPIQADIVLSSKDLETRPCPLHQSLSIR